MKYSSVVSCRDGIPLKRHWFDKPNKRWWGLIINGGIDDGVWWPWAPSDWICSLWIMNEEIPDWSVQLSLFQILSRHFNGAFSTWDNTPTPAGRDASLLSNKIMDKMWIHTVHSLLIKGGFWTCEWEHSREYYLNNCSKWRGDETIMGYIRISTSEKTLRVVSKFVLG